MGMFSNLNTTLVIETADRFFAHRAFTSVTKGPYHTQHDYQLKLRDAVVKLYLKLQDGSHFISIECVDRAGRKVIYPKQSISNPFECQSRAEEIWEAIYAADKSVIGSLDDARHLDYLDWVFFLAHALRKWELENGQLFPHKSLDDFVHQVSSNNSDRYPCDPSEASKDVCKLMGEMKILDRYMHDHAHADQINDTIYLEARLLIESSYDGVTDFKQRKY